MRWTAPPDKREIWLLIFALTVFLFSYHLDNALWLLGYDPETAHGVVLSSLGIGSAKLIAPDGRRPPGWRDSLEDEIFGSWGWEEGQLAGDGAERSQELGVGMHGATWAGRKEVGELRGRRFGERTVNDGFVRWGEEIPQSKLVRHVSGYSILDNVFIFKGKVYIVTDDRDAFPSISSIVAAVGPGKNTWEVISKEDARKKLGTYGAVLHGVTWMSADTTPHNSTLLALWRAYSSLDPHIDSSGRTTLPPPHRLFFPQVRVFTDPNPLPHFHTIRRRRVDTGFHPFFLKAAFPQLTVMYLEDWEDYHKLPVPFVVERIVVSDREAADTSVTHGQPVFSPAFDLVGSRHWWEPIRRTLTAYFGEELSKQTKKAVTYIHRQSEKTGMRLRDEDHQSLVRALKKMERGNGYEVHVVSSQFDEAGWTERMGAIVKSTVVLGPCSSDLLDSVFMKPSPQATLMEFFPTDTYGTLSHPIMTHDDPNAVSSTASSVTVEHEKTPPARPMSGESALPEDKVEEALENLEDDWENDPDNARNWSFSRKWTAVSIVSLYTFVSPLASSMMAPGLEDVAIKYDITNSTIVALTLSIYLLSFAIGPLILAPLSEMYGRTWVLHIGNIFSLGFILGCAFSPNTGSLIAFRFLSGFSGSAPIACGGGSIGDLFSERDRASAMAVYSLGPLIGPVIGPIAGGFITQTVGIKWVFIVIAILCGLSGVVGIPILKETYGPVIRMRRAKGDPEALARITRVTTVHENKAAFLWENLTRPLVMLSRSFICFILSLYMAFLYGIYYLMFATFAQLFRSTYGFKTGVGGLAYLGLGMGFFLATVFGAKTADQVYKHLADKNGGKGKPEMRIPALFFGSFFVPIGLFWYGWSAQAKLHWIMPIIGSGIFGFGMMSSFLPIQLYLVDAFRFAASATAAASVFRSMLGFAFPLFGKQMFDVLGVGGGNSVSLTLTLPTTLDKLN
ncbi:hypothetical protein D9615_008391 [Tricholomella constricta]|uniref:Major facilitator superfamily (MFS) profile domain-containing protein n=1 Tax=Tricholomella constricta TaxID=117010 RepID=A0A8H5HDE2_9AGAR|nr:hypothetical protein D9615_008391 [Tricholomella constricta]